MDNFDLAWLHSKIRECETAIRECQEAIERKQRERLEATSSVQLVMNDLYYYRDNRITYGVHSVDVDDYQEDVEIVFALACEWLPF